MKKAGGHNVKLDENDKKYFYNVIIILSIFIERRKIMQRFLGIIVGVIFLTIGVFMYIKNDNLVKNCTEETKAIVVDMKQELSTDSDSTSYMYYPIVEYKVGEDTLRVTIDAGSSTPAYNIDEQITILYNPNKPKEFIVKGEKSSIIFAILFMTFGVLVTGYGIKIAIKKD